MLTIPILSKIHVEKHANLGFATCSPLLAFSMTAKYFENKVNFIKFLLISP